jgi:hypothetical protein
VVNWNKIIKRSRTRPTFQLVTNPLTTSYSPIRKKVYQNVADLGTEMSRLALWFPYPHLAVAELKPPNCSASTNKTSWDFQYMDPMIIDFFSALTDRTPCLSASTQPQWMWKTDKPIPYPDDPNQVAWDYRQGTELVDPTVKQLAEYYARVASWYTKGGFIDECGTYHHSGYDINIHAWEVFNEMDGGEHQISVEDYTKMYDTIVMAVKKVTPNTQFVGLAMEAPIPHFHYFPYFLNHSNHQPGVPLDWISYHHYGIPNQTFPIDTYFDQMINQLEIFLETVRKVEVVRKQLSPQTKTTINEFGSILLKSATQPKPEPINDDYWIISGAVYAYGFIQMSIIGIDALGMSQMVGFPTQYPSVSMVNWNNGTGNARYQVLKLIVEHFDLQLGKRFVDIMDTQSTGAIFAQGFLVTKATTKQRKVLIINKQRTSKILNIQGAKGGVLSYVDLSTGPYGPSKTITLQADSFNLGGYGVGVVVLPQV